MLYYRWLETIPSRPIFFQVTVVDSEENQLAYERIVRERLAPMGWFSEVAAEPRLGGCSLELQCSLKTFSGSGVRSTAQAHVNWVLSRLGERDMNERQCIAAGDFRRVKDQRYCADMDWLKREAFAEAVDGILHSLAVEQPSRPVARVVERKPLDKNVAPFSFRLCGSASNNGLGMAYTYISDSLGAGRWVKMLAGREMDVLMKEIRIAESDTSEERMKKVGQALAGADMLLLGTASEHGGCLEIDARLVDVSTGTIVDAAHGGCYRKEQVQSTCASMANHLSEQPLREPGNAWPRIAVAIVTNRSPDAEKRELGTIFASAVTTALAERQGVYVLERTWIEQILAERKFLDSDLVYSNVGALGKLLTADYLVVGDVDNDSVSVSVIEVGTGVKVPLAGGSARFLMNRSFWQPATELADRIVAAVATP
jgi:curli biogenesis system outer membrane secretion channel CsgG